MTLSNFTITSSYELESAEVHRDAKGAETRQTYSGSGSGAKRESDGASEQLALRLEFPFESGRHLEAGPLLRSGLARIHPPFPVCERRRSLDRG